MSKWKCEICGKEFENFHAQGFDNKIYCPLCYFKKENQELKKQLEDLQETHYLIQGGRSNGKTYLMKLQADKEQLNSLVNSCQEEIRRLKKQLENKYEKVGTLTSELLYEENTKLINQQKEFIEYLEEQIKDMEEEIGNSITKPYEESHIIRKNVYQEILSKYQEIIGVSE